MARYIITGPKQRVLELITDFRPDFPPREFMNLSGGLLILFSNNLCVSHD